MNKAANTVDRNRVDIWLCQSVQTAHIVPSEWLSNEELTRLNRYRSTVKQQQFLAARVFLKKTLSYYVSLKPSQWQFAIGQYGKPVIDWCASGLLEDPQLSFNLSHSSDCLALLVTQQNPVGIDVESLSRPRPWPKLAKRVCTDQEQRDLARLPEAQQFSHFIKLWAHKEAVLKAMGLGINSQWPMNSLGFGLINTEELCFMPPANFPHSHINLYSILLHGAWCASAILDCTDSVTWNIKRD
ncbi:4'-phosphopantetheinyl transferase superfamily protein [Endozoicomonas sp. SM1973]|uniref:4'-phosphopantetheinyl transferase superfamily protein n=1 Tax=Spartinivicinus marinus TaxID=2994442 RepID=A0A853IJE8_9GAMM|nr:4'-phosphopantetheinyl transferase superfamily protein [Spartinivicinus marinus]MCX4025393.1 4'-phosphopantetheinyl transferase superfamily protein [Spartinivicinus marinus]NYZ69205.1 4'-phosphopantetheinyl transferase superfamily protein [Spartinivicinus marinus]